MNSEYNNNGEQWNYNQSTKEMTDRIHSEVKSMVVNSRLVRLSQGIALVNRRELQIGELLGRGAFSEVHEVRVINNPGCNSQCRYAMKHLKAKLLSQADNFRLAAVELAVEAHMLASFDHPNIMKIRGWAANGVASFTTGRHDSFFLLLDCLDETLDQRISTWQQQKQHQQHTNVENIGINLHLGVPGNLVSGLWKRFAQNPNDENHHHNNNINNNIYHNGPSSRPTSSAESLLLEKLGICVEIAAALSYLHHNGVIFRDLKPNNIGFLNGRVQLFDFGLSRELPMLKLDEPFEMSGKVVRIVQRCRQPLFFTRTYIPSHLITGIPNFFIREHYDTWHRKSHHIIHIMYRLMYIRGPWYVMKYLF
jgi:serine/threonine protein kinase